MNILWVGSDSGFPTFNPILGGLNPAFSDIFLKWLENYEDILVKTSLTPQKKAEVS